jgi:glycosyltransferase involved in cell wall biosynthesis
VTGNEFPRVLFVTPAAFNHLTGGGVTFSNLFSGWPTDRIATVHNDTVPTSDDVCARYYVLGRAEIDLFAPLRVVRALRDREVKAKFKAAGGAAGGAGSTVRAGAGLIARVQGDSAPQRVRLTGALERWIADFKPDLLYTLLGSNAFMELTTAVRRTFALPTVIHMMDDFPTINYRRGAFARYERGRMEKLLAENFAAATTCMGICAEMCAAFSQRYGRPFVPFQNCVDVERWRPVVRTDGAVRGAPPRVLYFGSVFANAQLASLVDLCRSIARLNADGVPVGFDIASPASQIAAHRGDLMVHPAIRLIEPTRDDREFFATLAAADALVLPINYDAATVDFIRYSMPTKVPAYMASGTPILVYGPRGVAQVDYAAREGWGHVVYERDDAALDSGVRRILADAPLRESLRTRAQALASANHDSVRVRNEFQAALKAAAQAR